MKPTFLEFFAGGGMARAGLSPEWRCLFANDIDPKKASVYRTNWGDSELHLGDIEVIDPRNLPKADLTWASFPCQDLSLAGSGKGLSGKRSGLFWALWSLLHAAAVRPDIVVLENVIGILTSRRGDDFKEICRALASLNYVFGAMVIDALHFVPQSRPRLFLVATRSRHIPGALISSEPDPLWVPDTLKKQYMGLSPDLRAAWRWWKLPVPAARNSMLSDLIMEDPSDVAWHDASVTARLLGMMTDVNMAKVQAASRSGRKRVGAVYRRTRIENGLKFQRAEVRFDDVAGCLRTPGGGSSRQIILVVEGDRIRSRLLSKYEAASLMGYGGQLPINYNEAYHFLGDGLAVPVVRFLSENLLLPLISSKMKQIAA
jgi:DNA (cytosine-5)-methyltransferase 1